MSEGKSNEREQAKALLTCVSLFLLYICMCSSFDFVSMLNWFVRVCLCVCVCLLREESCAMRNFFFLFWPQTRSQEEWETEKERETWLEKYRAEKCISICSYVCANIQRVRDCYEKNDIALSASVWMRVYIEGTMVLVALLRKMNSLPSLSQLSWKMCVWVDRRGLASSKSSLSLSLTPTHTSYTTKHANTHRASLAQSTILSYTHT